jgi:hypothetical protein
LRPNLGNLRHHLIFRAIDSVLVIKRHLQADDGDLAGCGKSREFSRDVRCSGAPWIPGTRPGMTISLDFNGFVMAGLVPWAFSPRT